MARYIGPVCRLCRREGMKLFLKGERCYTEKCAIEKRNLPPGQHGKSRKAKLKGVDSAARGRPGAVAPKPGDEREPMSTKDYDKALKKLHVELVKLQQWVVHKGLKVCIVFEGRDGAGKGGTIKAITERVSPRVFRVVALPAPTEREKSQMYAQRYLPHLPAAGEVVIFDRSWYNRAGVERVMGFCTEEQAKGFLKVVPAFFAHEGAMLARLAGRPVPRLIAHEGNRLLLDEIPGTDLYGAPLPFLRRMVPLLVSLQQAEVGRVDDLLALGLPDWRGPAPEQPEPRRAGPRAARQAPSHRSLPWPAWRRAPRASSARQSTAGSGSPAAPSRRQ